MHFKKNISSISWTILLLIFLGCNNIICAQEKKEIDRDSIQVAIAPGYDSVGKLHRFLFGEGYRKLWAAPVKLKILNLSIEKGGMTVLRMGGGLQTKSLRLKDASGKEWALRTIQKYPERGLPPNLRAGLARDILQDQVITAHPFSFLVVPPLAEALEITHAHPEIVYVPDDPLLGEFRGEFRNAVFLLEERDPLEGSNSDNTEKVQRELQQDNDDRVEQQLVLKARLLDLVLGDWDRHEDQWRWGKQEDKNNSVYVPIPRDRDKVFYNTSGVFPWIVSHQWLKSNLQGYHPDTRDIKGYNFNNRYFDRYFLNRLSEQDWKEAVAFVQRKLTDSLIGKAIRLLPATIYSLSGNRLVQTMIARRNNLMSTALEYYRFISLVVDIPASDKNENFDVNTNGDGAVSVHISKIKKDGTTGSTTYNRVFDPTVTKEVRMYGFDGSDVFTAKGNGASAIKIRMIGGKGTDSFSMDPDFTNRRKLFVYDRKAEQNSISSVAGARVRLSNDSTINLFNKKAFKYDRFALVTLANYTIDDGLLLIGGFSNEKQGFRKEPYAFHNELLVSYSLARYTFLINYFAEFKGLVGKNDLGIHLYSRGPHSINNFFGIGNETIFENKEGKRISYYRSRYDYVNVDARLYRKISPGWRISGGVAAQYYTSSRSDNNGRYFDKYNSEYPGSLLYKNRIYAGFVIAAEMDTRNSIIMPSNGVYWNTTVKAMQEMGGERSAYGNLVTECSFFLTPFNTAGFVIAARIGGGTTMGSPAFFQQLFLGGKQTLRGFHTNRFAGKSMLYNNFELRMKLFDFNSYLFPGTVGLLAFNDIGRVWLPGENSSKWHDGYGTGIYILPAQLLVIQAAVGFSKEGTLPYISVGFRF